MEELNQSMYIFSGQVNDPGISLVHPFSDIISALIQAGGVNSNGSLRQIQLIRSNKKPI